MKKIAVLLALLCTSILNGMDPEFNSELNIETLSLEVQDHIITTLNTYDNLNDIIYAIRALNITSKTFKEIINEKYGTPKKLKKLAHRLYWNFRTKQEQSLNDYKKIHAHAYKAVDKWHKNAQFSLEECLWYVNSSLDEEEVSRMFSNYENALEITNAAPHVSDTPIWYIIEQFKTPAARQYPQMIVAHNLLNASFLSYDIIKNFIDKGIEINYCNSQGITPLLHVLQMGSSPKVIQLLLSSGANPHVKDNQNNGVFEYLDRGYPQNCEWYKMLKPKVQKLLEDAVEHKSVT